MARISLEQERAHNARVAIETRKQIRPDLKAINDLARETALKRTMAMLLELIRPEIESERARLMQDVRLGLRPDLCD